MMWQWFNTLRIRLIIYITISTLIPLTILGLMSYRLAVSALNQQANDLTQSIIYQEVRNIEGFVRDAKRLANDLIRSTPIRSAIEIARSANEISSLDQLRIRSNIESQLASTINLQGLIAIEVYADGQVFSMGDLTAGTDYNIERLTEWINSCEAQQSSCWPGIEINTQPSSQYGFVIPAIFPIIDFNQTTLSYDTIGHLILKYDVDRLYEEVHSEQSEFMYLVLVDDKARTVYHPQKSKLRQPFAISSIDLDANMGTPIDTEISDNAVRLFVTEVPIMNWKAVGVIPLDTIVNRVLDISRLASLFFAFAFGLMVIAIFFVSKRVVEPITHITDIVKGKTTGEVTSEKSSIEEIQQLIHWFNQYKHIVDKEKVQQEELRVAYEELRQTQDHLIESEKMAALGNIVAGVAHEINTPLGVSITANSIFLDSLPKMMLRLESGGITRSELVDFLSQSNEAAEVLRVNLDRAAKLVNTFKRTAANQHSDHLEKFALKPYIDEVISSLMPAFKNHDIQVTVEGSESLFIRSYPGILWQVFSNLIMNSLHHAFEPSETGNVHIEIEQEVNGVKIIYRDTGKGIPPDNLPKIFDPFFTTRRHAGSTGLGLNIIYNLVCQELKGQLSCDSELGKGVQFSITLPDLVE